MSQVIQEDVTATVITMDIQVKCDLAACAILSPLLSSPQPPPRLEAQRATPSDQIQREGDLPRIQAAFHSPPLSLSVAETEAVRGRQL